MSRKAPVFAVFCLITAALSLVYLIVYQLWLQPQAYEINGYSLLYNLLCRQLLSFSVVGGTVSFFTNFFLKTIPAPVRMLLLIVPIFFLLMYAFGCLFHITGWLSPSMSLLLHTFTHLGWFGVAGGLFGLGSARLNFCHFHIGSLLKICRLPFYLLVKALFTAPSSILRPVGYPAVRCRVPSGRRESCLPAQSFSLFLPANAVQSAPPIHRPGFPSIA